VGVGSGALLGVFFPILRIRVVDQPLNTCSIGQHRHVRLFDQPVTFHLVEIDYRVERLSFFGFDNRTRPILVEGQGKYLSLRERMLAEALTHPFDDLATIAKLRHFPRVFDLDSHVCLLPNVLDEPRPQLARRVPHLD
jgi:hypothetical protein